MSSREPQQYVRNMAYAAFAGQSGCATATIVLGALVLGLWLDSILGTKPVFTLCLLITSVPVSLYIMVRMVLSAIRRITPPSTPPSEKKDIENERREESE